MKLSKEFFYTIRENVNDEDSISGFLLVKAGYIKKVSNGIYAKLPLGMKVTENIKKVIRDCMNEQDATEIVMPSLIPSEIFEKTSRAESFGNFMFTLRDRVNRKYALGPTDEEMFALISINKVKSYKDLPYTLYQISSKYRDEMRPRLGLIRTREFTMKDAYSFDADLEGLEESYQKMFKAYHKIFKKVGLDYVVVRADCGIMGGMLSEEFQAISDTGEDTLVLCDTCSYASNLEIGTCKPYKKSVEKRLAVNELYTPNTGKIEDIINKLNIPISKLVKTIIYKVDSSFYACMVAGNREINETKLAKLLNATEISLADTVDVKRITSAEVGFAGPIGLDIPIVVDDDVAQMQNFVVGANKTDYHFANVNINDFIIYKTSDIKNVIEGDICLNCNGKLSLKKGIEVANTFKLGTKYSEKMNLNYLAKDNKRYPVVMGSYGIGVERIIASIVEQNHDEKGIIWPISIAPYKVAIVVVDTKDSKQTEIANNLYKKLTSLEIDSILDDRDIRVGVKFNDMDLIGIPIRITIGKNCYENIVEYKLRKGNKIERIYLDEVIANIKKILK